jgi:hypothetical protein
MDPDNLILPVTHSLFFRDLAVRGHKLTYARADDSGLALTSYGEYLYDNLIMFSPKTEDFGGSLDVAAIVEFVDSGRNLLLVATPDSSDSIRELAAECGIVLVDEERAYVQDHFSHDADMDEGNHTIVVSEDFAAPDVVLGKVRQNRATQRPIPNLRPLFPPPRRIPPHPAPAPHRPRARAAAPRRLTRRRAGRAGAPRAGPLPRGRAGGGRLEPPRPADPPRRVHLLLHGAKWEERGGRASAKGAK